MAEQVPPFPIFAFNNPPGVKRDGTDLDNDFWQLAQWVRFQRGRPRKIGGYRLMTNQLVGPIRHVYVDSRASGNSAHTFSKWGVEKLLFGDTGAVSGVFDRTPSGFIANSAYTWQSGVMFQSGGGGTPTLIAAATPDGVSVASDTVGKVYSGDITANTALTVVNDGSADVEVSGGCCILQPFLFVYGSNGLIRNSNANDVSTASGWTVGGANQANTANVSATKVVRGIPMRGGGQSPSGLFWALDSLLRVSFIGGASLWKYDTLSVDVTIISKASVIEYDNVYYWIGTDRFYAFNGVVQEVPNNMNMNWFFDNLNFEQRSKVWAMKIPRFGEIWWFFPSGTSTECDEALIFNVREGAWYDTSLERSAGFPARIYPSPLMAGENLDTVAFTFTQVTGAFSTGHGIVGLTSGAVATISRVSATQLNLVDVTGTFVNGETIEDTTHGGVDTGTITSAPFAQQTSKLWQHETGVDRIDLQDTEAIRSFIVSNNMQWMTGGPGANQNSGANTQTRLTRVEPDFIMSGEMTLTVQGKSFAQSDLKTGEVHTFDGSTEFISLREQYRELAIRLESNVAGGTFQMGKLFMSIEPGDERG